MAGEASDDRTGALGDALQGRCARPESAPSGPLGDVQSRAGADPAKLNELARRGVVEHNEAHEQT